MNNAERGTLNAERRKIRHSSLAFRFSFSIPCSAFTLTEILVVIGLIVLMLALAVPAFNLITGSRSIEGAVNQLSASLGNARMRAIGLQKCTGIMFFIDPRSGRRSIAIVNETDAPSIPAGSPANPDIWLDVADVDVLPLPSGISAQTMCDTNINSATNPPTRTADGYIGYNVAATKLHFTVSGTNQTETSFGGVILFDGSGQLTSKSYGFRCVAGGRVTSMGLLLFPSGTVGDDYVPGNPLPLSNLVPLLRSQFGLVMFEVDPFKNASSGFKDDETAHTNGDPLMTQAPYGPDELAEEIWLDQNATPILINRFNGTIVKGQ